MFFRQATLFTFGELVAQDLSRLEEALADYRLRPCGPLEEATHGFLSPVGKKADSALTHTIQEYTLLVAASELKLLPGAVINDALSKKVSAIEDAEQRRVGAKERARLKEDLQTTLLQQAFIRQVRTRAYVDVKARYLVVETASRKSAEHCVSQIREALGSFPAVPLAPASSPREVMTNWLASGELPEGLALGDECELREPATATGAISRSRRQDLDSEEIKEHLRNGKQVFQLGLVYRDRLSFTLGEDLVIRKLRFLDVVTDELGRADDAAAELDSTFALQSLELGHLLGSIATWFTISKPD